jgi:N-acetylneuraminic acid mutarotase
MPDQARAAGRERQPQSPQNIKIMRSQRIAPVSPIDSRPPPSELYDVSELPERAPLIPRSHTPGHLSSKSQDRRNKPADLVVRQRAQSSAAAGTPSSSSSGITPSLTSPPSASFSASSTKTPTPISTFARHPPSSATENGDAAATAATAGRERQDSSVGGGSSSKETARRPPAIRSTSAIAGRPAGPTTATTTTTTTTAPGLATNTVTRLGTGRGAPAKGAEVHTFFPALADPKTAPDVPAAPASGMYWSRAPVSGAPHTALRAHTSTLVGSNVFVFGGCDARACFNALYVLDADGFYWSAPHVVGDVPVPLRAMTCTAVGKKLVVFGGGDGPAYYNDVYVLDTVNFRWSKPRIMGDRVPSKRRAHTACLYKSGIYVFGGGDGVRALNDIWRLDVSDMSKMSWKLVSGPSSEDGRSPVTGKDLRPKARGYHTANMVGSKLIIYGGSDGGECFSDVWVYDVETHAWKAVSIPTTYRRLSHTATIVGSYLFVIGGHDGNEYSNDVLLLNLVTMTWDRRRVYGLPPSGRGYHGTVLHDSRLLMIGGFDGSEVFGDVWSLELAVHSYYSQISHFTIEV